MRAGPTNAESASIQTDIPARLDRLPWSRFHWLLIVALGVTWILDGFEATVVAAINPVLTQPATLGLRDVQVGLGVTGYLAGCIGGALFFGHLTDRLGRKRLFNVTLLIYFAGAFLTAVSWDFWSFLFFRTVTGTAIGGEYAAINSAIDELIPARLRGRVDLAVNGTFWLGAMLGAGASVLLLDPHRLPVWLGWRVAIGLGGTLGFVMIFVRRHVPESPRWLLTHGRRGEAEETMNQIESRVGDVQTLEPVTRRLTIHSNAHISEIFPLEMRALAIALFYSVGTAIGGLGAPALFGILLDSGREDWLVGGYLLGAGLMLTAAATELVLGVAAERRSLEDVTAPLSSEPPEEKGNRSPQPTPNADGRPEPISRRASTRGEPTATNRLAKT